MTGPQKERTQPGGAGSLDALTGSAGESKDTPIAFSCGNGRYDNTPIQLIAKDADAFFDWVEENRAAAKGDKWLAASFSQRCSKAHELGQPHRCATCVDDTAFLGHDVDGGLTAESGAMFVQVIQKFRGLVHPTASSTPEAPRYRVLLALDRALPRQERIELSARLRAEVDGDMRAAGYAPPKWDAACDRPEQMLYLALPDARVYRLEGEVIRTANYVGAALALGDRLTRLNVGAASTFSFSPSATFGPYPDSGKVVETERHPDVLKLCGRLARDIVLEGLARDSAITALLEERKRGRWSRFVPDSELIGALDGALENFRSGEWPAEAANDAGPSVTPLAEALARELTSFTDEDYARASVPHPHVFSDGNAGMFPVGEVTTIAAPGREGKTTATTFVVSRAALGGTVAGLASKPMRVLIYSNEDDRIQYARKIMALRSLLSADDAARLHDAIVVPNLEAPDLMQVRALVELTEKRRPVPTPMVDAIIDAVRPWVEGDDPVGTIVFETVSTLSEADEDNPGLKALTAAAKRIARRLNVAVILVHHTNQSAGGNYKDLNFSVADMRGGTVLPYNSRQCLLLVSLGSDEEPFPADDGRTLLRKLVVGQLDSFGFHDASGARISALVPLDTSKATNPPPAFFAWTGTPFGPAVREILPPQDYVGMKWSRLRQALLDKIKALNEAKREARAAKTDQESQKNRAACIDAVRELEAEHKAPTVKAVSVRLKKANDWAKPFLAIAVGEGELVRSKEKVPHAKGEHDVYRLPAADPNED